MKGQGVPDAKTRKKGNEGNQSKEVKYLQCTDMHACIYAYIPVQYTFHCRNEEDTASNRRFLLRLGRTKIQCSSEAVRTKSRRSQD
jgi:hypothetical protein